MILRKNKILIAPIKVDGIGALVTALNREGVTVCYDVVLNGLLLTEREIFPRLDSKERWAACADIIRDFIKLQALFFSRFDSFDTAEPWPVPEIASLILREVDNETYGVRTIPAKPGHLLGNPWDAERAREVYEKAMREIEVIQLLTQKRIL